MRFDELELEDSLLQGLDAMNFQETTPIQELTIPVILEGKDLIAVSYTHLDVYKRQLYGRGFYLFPLGKRQEYIFATETPQYYLCRPISLEDRSFIVFHELLQFRLVTESNVKTLVKIAGFRFLLFIEIKFSVGFGREISVLGIGF